MRFAMVVPLSPADGEVLVGKATVGEGHHPAVYELHRHVLQAGKLPGASRKDFPTKDDSHVRVTNRGRLDVCFSNRPFES